MRTRVLILLLSLLASLGCPEGFPLGIEEDCAVDSDTVYVESMNQIQASMGPGCPTIYIMEAP